MIVFNYNTTKFNFELLLLFPTCLAMVSLLATVSRLEYQVYRNVSTTSLRYLQDVRCDTAAIKPRIKESLNISKLSYEDGHSSYLVTPCPFCPRTENSSTTLFINKTTGGSVCKPCNLKGEVFL